MQMKEIKWMLLIKPVAIREKYVLTYVAGQENVTDWMRPIDMATRFTMTLITTLLIATQKRIHFHVSIIVV